MIRAIYHVLSDAAHAGRVAADIALEQTVEVPEALACSVPAAARLIGTVAGIEPLEGAAGKFKIAIDYETELAGGQLPQLLNLLFGNISIKPGIRLADVELPEDLLARFAGPRYGIEGLRAELGIYERPLLASALKPRGSTPDELAAIAGAFARGGGDLIKDDHNLVDVDFAAWRERVLRCRDAVAAANAKTGRRTFYLPNIMNPAEAVEPMLELLVEEGVGGFLISPLILGMDALRRAAAQFPLFVMAHPAFSGSYYASPDQGIAPGLLLGKLMRLAGADASVFPNHGGRFALTPGDCDAIGDGLRKPLGAVKGAWPAPAGGMNYERLGSMADQYGEDTIFLIGGGLLADSGDLAASTARFLDAIRERFGEQRLTPLNVERFSSSCDIPAPKTAAPSRPKRERLAFLPEAFAWQDRPATDYKPNDALPFSGVTRHELIGPAGEEADFDLRYFEVAPGGFTSLERHNHTHTVIAIRGEGVLVSDGRRLTLNNLDIGYIAPDQPHQLRNEGSEPFGFFCIVDRDRDRPRPA